MPGSSALTIGNFDGVHRGHAALVRTAREAVGPTGTVTAVTFEPHPAAVLRPHAVPPRLCTPDQRRAWLEAAGADQVDVVASTLELLERSPERFIAELVEQHHPTVVVEGPDFRFGRGRIGTIDTLRTLGARFGFAVVDHPPVEAMFSDQSVVRVSSSIIRWLLRHGRVADAARCLGRPYELEAPVVRGDQRGRRIGFPTANLRHGDQLLPADGVYAGFAVMPGGRIVSAAVSVGTKPTFGPAARVCEAHFLDHDGPFDDYGWAVRVQFVGWLRDQLGYPTLEALVAQLERDVSHARTVLSFESPTTETGQA